MSKLCRNCYRAIVPDDQTDTGWIHELAQTFFCDGRMESVAEPADEEEAHGA